MKEIKKLKSELNDSFDNHSGNDVKSRLNLSKNNDENEDKDLIEDILDLPGTIEKAKIHGNSQKILYIDKKNFASSVIIFCNDCFLPQETEGIIKKFNYCTPPKKLYHCGYGLYLFFIVEKYLIINYFCLIITCSLPYILICNAYANKLNDYCTEFYVKDTIPVGLETNNEYCVNFISSDEYDYTKFDWMNKWSGQTMIFYIKILKDFATQKQIDDVICNFNLISFISLLILFIINMLFISLTSALKNEIDFKEQSPSDYTLIVSDIPTEQYKPGPLKNDYLDPDDNVDIKEINLSYKLTEIKNLKRELIEIKKKLKNNKTGFYEEGILCFKKKKTISSLILRKKQILKALKKLEEDYSKSSFNGVAFIIFNKENEAINYKKKYPSTFIGKLFINIRKSFALCFCGCCISQKTKKSLKIKSKITVDLAPEPEDVIFENLEFHFISRLFRSLLLYFFSILLAGISFGIVTLLNYIQYKKEKDIKEKFIFKYGLSLAITLVTITVNFLIKRLFIKFADYEKPWTYTDKYLSISMKFTILSFFNTAIVPLVSNIIQYGKGNYEVLVNNMFMIFVVDSILHPLMSLTCYDLILNRFFRWFFITRKYKNEKEELPLSQREVNHYFENPDMRVYIQYSHLSAQIIMTFFYMPLFPLGPFITLIGIILNYLIEKLKCFQIYKRPEKLNEKIAFFYIDYFEITLFAWSIGNYIFYGKLHSSKLFELFNLFFYGFLLIIPYATFIRKYDISGAYSLKNEITYDDAFLNFSVDYERLNPKTQKRGAMNYIDRLVKMELLTKEMGEKAKEKIDNINLKMLYHVITKTKDIEKNSNIERNDDEIEKIGIDVYENEKVNKKLSSVNFFLNNLGIVAGKEINKKGFFFNNIVLFGQNNLNNINPIFSAVYHEMAQKKYAEIFGLKRNKDNVNNKNNNKKNSFNDLIIDDLNEINTKKN